MEGSDGRDGSVRTDDSVDVADAGAVAVPEGAWFDNSM